MKSITIGLDIAKSVFQVHGEDARGRIILQKRLRRSQVEAFFAALPPARIGIEACGWSHHWGRTLRAQGHEVRLIPAAYVKPSSGATRPMRAMQRRSASPSAVRTSASSPSRASSSRRRAASNGRASCWSSSIRS